MEKKIIIAAGGLVLNEKNELLLIFRRGFWDLPKGKLDKGETIEACAIREVMEETGIRHVALVQFIGKTHHTYFDKWLQEEVIKESVWFEMRASSLEKLVPQLEEDITAIGWFAEEDWQTLLVDTYPSIVQIIQQWNSKA
jgi:8-oxo-dGTP pyrophosphatase MutT (NUDIX family)